MNGSARKDRVTEDMEAIFGRVTSRQLAAPNDGSVPHHPRTHKVVPTDQRRGGISKRVAAPILAGCVLAAILGILAVTERSGTAPPQVVTRSPAEAGKAARELSASARGSIVKAETGLLPKATTRREEGSRVTGETGEATVRAFYAALGAGDGQKASAQVIAEKRSSRAFSPGAISRFYGGLPEPIRLISIAPLARDAYHVSYRYSAGRSPCDGEAVVSVTRRDGRNFIRSIRALNGC